MNPLPPSRRLAISRWVNRQFQIGAPQRLPGPPAGLAGQPHWPSDPASGLTGDVHLAADLVYFHSTEQPAEQPSAWWKVGPLPASLS